VPDRPNVAVRLVPLELRFRHLSVPRFLISSLRYIVVMLSSSYRQGRWSG
jgi:hypothetical protein